MSPLMSNPGCSERQAVLKASPPYRRSRGARALLVLALVGFPTFAWAYVDPGSGLLLWQLLASVVIGALFYVKQFAAAIRRLFRRRDEDGK